MESRRSYGFCVRWSSIMTRSRAFDSIWRSFHWLMPGEYVNHIQPRSAISFVSIVAESVTSRRLVAQGRNCETAMVRGCFRSGYLTTVFQVAKLFNMEIRTWMMSTDKCLEGEGRGEFGDTYTGERTAGVWTQLKDGDATQSGTGAFQIPV